MVNRDFSLQLIDCQSIISQNPKLSIDDSDKGRKRPQLRIKKRVKIQNLFIRQNTEGSKKAIENSISMAFLFVKY